MVVAYLEKIKEKYIEEKVQINIQLDELVNRKKESSEFIQKLEKENNSTYEVFTPRIRDSYNKDKIDSLLEEQKVIEENIEKIKNELDVLEKEISEVSRIINIAKRKRM